MTNLFKHQSSFSLSRKLIGVALLLLSFSVEGNGATVTSSLSMDLTTDRACYSPGQVVTFTASSIPSGARVCYRFGANVVEDVALAEVATGNTWTWTPPKDDFKGYLAEIYTTNGDNRNIIGTIAVDVSSNWKRFPRYGFVADFEENGNSAAKQERIVKEMAYLNRLHINGVQFQDWHWMHHKPVKFNADGSLAEWYHDVSNRWIGVKHIKSYIAEQHKYGMKSIFYNLCYGAWKDAYKDGVKPEWGLFKKDGSGNYYQDFHGLPDSWASNLYLQDPNNAEWQAYLIERNKEVYDNFDFDGYQIDQLGWRGDQLYDYNHNSVNLTEGYGKFIYAVKNAHPGKSLIMNVIGGYGAEPVATKDVDFCYDELWGDKASFAALFNTIQTNDGYSNHTHPTVFAAYMNYDKAGNPTYEGQYLNTPGVLLTDAVMFALGGAHLEMGDHMLTREYFPAAPLKMSDELRAAMIRYYDFLTAYQNLLRGETSSAAYSAEVSSANYKICAWPPQEYSITTFAKRNGEREIIHFINLLNTNDLSWRDVNGTRPAPEKKTNVTVTVKSKRKVSKVWVASPDSHGGAVVELSFTQNGEDVTFTLPSLEYWTMAVLESAQKEEFLRITGGSFWGFDLSKTVWMMKDENANVFRATVHINANEGFKFVNGQSETWEAGKAPLSYNAEYEDYNFNSEINTANIIAAGANDYKFTVKESANYDVVVDLDNMRIQVDKSAYQDQNMNYYPIRYVVGDHNGWNLTTATPLVAKDPAKPYLISGYVNFRAGQTFKLSTRLQNNWNQEQYVKGESENTLQFWDHTEATDIKWTIPADGCYLIEVNTADGTIAMKNPATITIDSNRHKTLYTEIPLNFEGVEGIKAYIASKVENISNNVKVTMTPINQVPANTAILLYGAPGTYNIPYKDYVEPLTSHNYLNGVTQATAIYPNWVGYDNYILEGGKFKPATGANIEAWSAYLSVPEGFTNHTADVGVMIEGRTVEHLVLTGAAYNSYDLGQSVYMVKDKEAGIFKATTYLEANKEFKFADGFDWGSCLSFNAEYDKYEFTSEINTANLVTVCGDLQFIVTESGNYDVTVNINTMRVSVTRAEYQGSKLDRYPALYVTGNHNSYDLNRADALTVKDPSKPYIVSGLVNLNSGDDFKFATRTVQDWSQTQFVKGATDNDIVPYTEGNDNKWNVTETGRYFIVVDKLANKVEIAKTPFNVNGLSYNITDEAFATVEVGSNASYSGDIAIPATIVKAGLAGVATVNAIGDDAFKGCTGVTSVQIPASIKSIGRNAFSGCNGLSVYCMSASVPANGGATPAADAVITMHVPYHSVDSYKSIWNGSNVNVVAGDATSVTAVANTGSRRYYATFSDLYSDAELSVANGESLVVYNARVEGSDLILEQRADNRVARGEGVLIMSSTPTVTVNPLAGNGLTAVSENENNLIATPVVATTVSTDETYKLYRLTFADTSKQTGLGFYWGNSNGTAIKAQPAKSYLKVLRTSVNSMIKGFSFGGSAIVEGIKADNMTGSEADGEIYDLSGRRVENPAPGFYIKGNSKVIIK